MAFQTHDVWLVKFPFSDLSTTLKPLLATLSPSCTVLRIGRLKPHDAQEISKRLRVMLDL
jgi:hypothetical protein